MPDRAPEELFAGRFRLRRELGSGGSAVVYEAEDLARSGLVVALKLLHGTPSAGEMRALRLEFEILSSLSHPHLPRAFDLHAVPGTGPAFLSMERIGGRPFLEAARDLPVPRTLELVTRVCRALAYLHDRGLVHRDVKSENILVENAGRSSRAVLMDLSLAGRDRAVLSARAGGTPPYLRDLIRISFPTFVHRGCSS